MQEDHWRASSWQRREVRGAGFKFNTKDQADMHLCTMEAIADFVGVDDGRDMRMLVKRGVGSMGRTIERTDRQTDRVVRTVRIIQTVAIPQ